jgi:serine phosphatase RsbU (regulator of sigma subunit)
VKIATFAKPENVSCNHFRKSLEIEKMTKTTDEIEIKYFWFKLTKRKFYYLYTIMFIVLLLIMLYSSKHSLDPKFYKFLPTSVHFLYENIHLVSIILLIYTVIEAQFVWNRIMKKQMQFIENLKTNLEIKNREILDSIEYALRIQTAILPPQKIVRQYLENSFILYKPKDIVAGDFYWMETVNDLVLFAACDCTGHGVPGAMVSVVCHNALNRAVREFGLTKPASILDKTAEIVLENFSKSEEEIQDGMDISICALNTKTKTLEWAGANNSLLLINNGQLTEAKADKQCIGYNDNIKLFTNHQFNLQPDTSIYLFTDGFADQFGGQLERKLTKSKFRELLLSIQHIPIQQQATELDEFIMNYKQNIEQTDDILVIGVRV